MASFCLAALFAGAAIAERPRPVSCPEEVPTVTVTRMFSGASTVSDISTCTEPRDTWTRTLEAYNATVTITEAENPYTTTIYDPDATYTSFIATEGVITTTCTETITLSQEATRTSYTGTYSSPLSPYCSTSTSYLYKYAQGTNTLHSIYATWPSPSWATAYTPAGTQTLTSYAHDPTEHATSTVYSSGTETSTLSTSCTATTYTATAPSAIVTQAAQCAPANLVANVEFVNYRDGTNRASWKTIPAGDEPGGVGDASACCQACLDEEGGRCLLSEFSEGGACSLRIGAEEEGQCGGLAASVSRGESGWGDYLVMAPGCGRLEEDFY